MAQRHYNRPTAHPRDPKGIDRHAVSPEPHTLRRGARYGKSRIGRERAARDYEGR